MTEAQFKAQPVGETLYDGELSRKYGRHVQATVMKHESLRGCIVLHIEGMDEEVPYSKHLHYVVFPDDADTLPYY